MPPPEDEAAQQPTEDTATEATSAEETPAETEPAAIDVAWAAGLFEGEGCVHSFTTGKNGNRYMALTVVSTDQDVVERFARIVGVGHLYDKKPNLARHKHQWQWRTSCREDVDHVRDLLLPHLGKRRTEKWVDCERRRTPRKRAPWSIARKEQHA